MEPENGQLWRALVFGDSSLPTGGFALSHGLETLVEEGQVTDASLGRVLAVFLQEIANGELIAFWHVAQHRDPKAGIDQAEQWLDRVPRTHEARQSSRWQGRRLLDIAARLSPSPGLLDLHRELYGGVAAAVLARALRMDAAAMATTYTYTMIREMGSAATRLIRLDPVAVSEHLWSLREPVEHAVAAAKNRKLSNFASVSPWLAIAAMRHQRQSMRLFRT